MLTTKQKQTLQLEVGRFLVDLAKMMFAGVILASIMQSDINKSTLLLVGAIVVAILAIIGFVLLLSGKEEKEDTETDDKEEENENNITVENKE